jgi:arsenate reductase-like glutaredoxin family protein
MEDNPAIIKRPVLDLGDRRVVGFKAEDYRQLF